MCGRPSAFRKEVKKTQGYAQLGRSPILKNSADGSAERFRTSDGEAEDTPAGESFHANVELRFSLQICYQLAQLHFSVPRLKAAVHRRLHPSLILRSAHTLEE